MRTSQTSSTTAKRPGLRRAALLLGALVLTAAGLEVGLAGTAQSAPSVAQVWVTTPDGTRKLSSGGSVAFDSAPRAIDIRVDAAQREQRFTGAGASVTEASAHLIQQLPAAQRTALMTSLFSTQGDGIGLNYLRQPLGSTDFNAGPFYTYEDTRGQFGIGRDQQEIIPVLRQALAVNPGIRFMGSPWSPPAWMKSGGSLNGGSLLPERYQDYADYLVRAIRAYAQQGITLTDLTVQNEPEFATSYPSTSMTATQQADFIRVLDRTLTAAGLPTNLLAYDHNWDHPQYPLTVFANTTGISRVIGAAFHCYGGDPNNQSQIRQAGKRVFFTECSGTDSTNPSQTFADTLRWHADNLVVTNMRTGGETVINWNLALDQNGGPHQGHCTNRCNGVVEINGGTVTRMAEYYVLGHLSKFVEPGAVRIGSTSQGAGGVRNVTFENPDGSRAAYVVNSASSAQTFSLTDGGKSLSYTLPAGAVATFVWEPDGTTPPPAGSIDPSRWYQVVNVNSGKCLDATGGGTGNGTAVQQWTCSSGNPNQQWQFQPTTDGHVRVVSRNATTAVWDVTGGSGATGDGVKVQLWAYGGAANQQWRPVSRGDGTWEFTARHSGRCLDVTDLSTADGARLQQWTCTHGPAQTFRLTPV